MQSALISKRSIPHIANVAISALFFNVSACGFLNKTSSLTNKQMIAAKFTILRVLFAIPLKAGYKPRASEKRTSLLIINFPQMNYELIFDVVMIDIQLQFSAPESRLKTWIYGLECQTGRILMRLLYWWIYVRVKRHICFE